ncbi:unnamed protein product [Cuscuta campestris]|uniref:Reverse transcriptase domain-containing protein n=1 Tax=Cuscuta campestris TaxID=132261 RepID=A0A484MPY4_9ASTE|nr:unnamed protein product [Cuscuta campestris]
MQGRADPNPDVIHSMFTLFGLDLLALIDPGPTLSYICVPLLANAVVARGQLESPMLVSNPLGHNMILHHVYRQCPLTTRGKIFPADLIELPYKEFDIILGMDWLTEHQAIVYCSSRTVDDEFCCMTRDLASSGRRPEFTVGADGILFFRNRLVIPYRDVRERLLHPTHRFPEGAVTLDENLTYEDEPVQILAREVKELRNKRVPLVKVLWRNHAVEEATWETEESVRVQYPHLFFDSDSDSIGAVRAVGLTGSLGGLSGLLGWRVQLLGRLRWAGSVGPVEWGCLNGNLGYSPYQDTDRDNYYESHGDQDDFDHNGRTYDDQPDPLLKEIIRLEQKIFYFDKILFAECSWYKPPYCNDYTLFVEEQIEANKVAIRERAKLLESVRKEKEFLKMMQKMLDDFQRERLEAEAKADKLVNDLCKAIEFKRSLQPQKEALEPKTNPESFHHQVPVLEDSPSSTPSQKPESITTLARATVVILPESLPSQVLANIVVREVEPTRPDSEPPMLIQEEKEEEVLPMAINDRLLNCVEDTPLEELALEEIEPTTNPQDSNTHESEEEPIDEEELCIERPIPSIETCANNDSSEDTDHAFFDSLLDGYDYVCPKDGWNLKSWDELLVSDHEDSSMGESTVVIIKPQMDRQLIEEEMEELLEGTRWQRLLQLRAESSLPLTIEFLCSISAVPEIDSRQMTYTLITANTIFAFTLVGQSFHLGLYTQEETKQPEFYDAPFRVPDALGLWVRDYTALSLPHGERTDPRPVQVMRELDAGMLRNAHIHKRLFPSSSVSTTASIGCTSHEMGESSGQSQTLSQRLPRRRPTRAQLARAQTEVAPALAQQLLENQNTLMRSIAALQQQVHGLDRMREALGFENPIMLE